MTDLTQQQRYEEARQRVDQIKGFYSNLFAYLLVIPILLWINLSTTSFLWVLFPAVGWGFGLLMHGMEAFGYNPLLGKDWERRKIRQLMEQDEQSWT